MLENFPQWLGALMRNVRAGHAKLTIAQDGIVTTERRIELMSPAFADGARLAERFTADGAGVSPPLLWNDVPNEADALALIVEDPDAPALNPMVHAIVWNIPASARSFEEGSIFRDGLGQPDGRDVGRGSLGEGWLPPDPPNGHGPHDYVFQLFALAGAPAIDPNPGRSAFTDAIKGHVVAAGLLVGTYSRGQGVGAGISAGHPSVA